MSIIISDKVSNEPNTIRLDIGGKYINLTEEEFKQMLLRDHYKIKEVVSGNYIVIEDGASDYIDEISLYGQCEQNYLDDMDDYILEEELVMMPMMLSLGEPEANSEVSDATLDMLAMIPAIGYGRFGWNMRIMSKDSIIPPEVTEPEEDTPHYKLPNTKDDTLYLTFSGKNLCSGRPYDVSLSSDNIPYIRSFKQPVLPYTPESSKYGIGYIVYCKAGTTYAFKIYDVNPNASPFIAEYECVSDTIKSTNAIGSVFAVNPLQTIKYTAKQDGLIICGAVGNINFDKIHECTEEENYCTYLYTNGMDPIEDVATSNVELELSTPGGLLGLRTILTSISNLKDDKERYWVSDLIEYSNKTGKRVKRIGKINIEHLAIREDDILENTKQLIINNPGVELMKAPLLTDRFTWSKDCTGIDEPYLMSVCDDGSSIAFRVPNKYSLDYFVKRPIVLYYVLKEPIETELSLAELRNFRTLYTNKLYNLISNSRHVYMNINMPKDVKIYIHKKLNIPIE